MEPAVLPDSTTTLRAVAALTAKQPIALPVRRTERLVGIAKMATTSTRQPCRAKNVGLVALSAPTRSIVLNAVSPTISGIPIYPAAVASPLVTTVMSKIQQVACPASLDITLTTVPRPVKNVPIIVLSVMENSVNSAARTTSTLMGPARCAIMACTSTAQPTTAAAVSRSVSYARTELTAISAKTLTTIKVPLV